MVGRRFLMMAPMQSKEEGGAPVSASSSCECRPDKQTVCITPAPQSSHTLARWMVGEIPDGSNTKQRGRRLPVSASSTCECWPNEQTAYSLHPHRTRSAAASLLVAYREIPEDGCTAKQRGRRLPLSASSSCECRPNRHTVCIRLARYRSRTLTGRVRSLMMASLQSKEEGGSLCWQAAPASAGQTGTQFASAPHRRAAAFTVLDWPYGGDP